MLNLDTHIVLHAAADDLRPNERRLLSSDSWGIASIVLWEITKLAQLKRIELDLDAPELQKLLSQIHIWELDLAVCREIPRLDFQGDPADEIIAATSIVHNVPLVTRDRVMRRSRRVPLA